MFAQIAAMANYRRQDVGTGPRQEDFLDFTFKKARLCALAIAALLPAACSPGPIGEDPAVVVANLSELPTPTAADFARSPTQEVVRPYDELAVAVFGVSDLSRTVRVGQGGFFDYPLIGAVQANGRTLAEIGYELETRLSGDYLREPDVTVEFVSREGLVFTAGGEVGSPGQFPITRPTTLMEAVSLAGGLNQYARRHEVLVFREIDNQRYIGVYDMEAIQRGNYADPQVYPNDVIMVGESQSRRMIDNILRYTQLIASPVILVDRITR